MSKKLILTLLCVFLLPALTIQASTTNTSTGSAKELINLVNQLRSANGLRPYKVNAKLMTAAQKHSEYQASINTVTHTGPGGSHPIDRVRATGYGNGATIFVSENIMGGNNLTPQGAVNGWQGDALHLNTMLSPNYIQVGAGLAYSGNYAYYTLDVAYIAGSTEPAPATPDATVSAGSTPQTYPTSIIIHPVVVSTPNADGSIIHIVEQGQALWNIVAAYSISMTELLSLNDLTENSLIHPGDELIIRPAQASPTVSVTHSQIITSTMTAGVGETHTPKADSLTSAARTITPSSNTEQLSISSSADEDVSDSIPKALRDNLLIAITVMVLVGTSLIIVGSNLKRK